MKERFEILFAVIWAVLGILSWLYPDLLLTNNPFIFSASNFLQPSSAFILISILLCTMLNFTLHYSIEIGITSIPLATILLFISSFFVLAKNLTIKISISLRVESEF